MKNDLLVLLLEMMKQYPNDMDLGGQVRKIIREINSDYGK